MADTKEAPSIERVCADLRCQVHTYYSRWSPIRFSKEDHYCPGCGKMGPLVQPEAPAESPAKAPVMFRDEAMNLRYVGCEHKIRECGCDAD